MACRVDTAPLLSGACVVSAYTGHGVPGSAVPSTGTHGPSPIYNDLSLPADAAKEYRWAIVTPPASGSLVIYEDGSYAFTAPGSGSYGYTYRLWEDGADKGTAAVSITVAAPADTTSPILSSPSASATSSTAASGSVTTNEGNGTLFRLASTSSTATVAAVKAGQSQAVSATGAQAVTFSGLSASTTYYAHFVHNDAAGNDSAVATSAAFTTQAAADTASPVLTGAITIGTVTTNSIAISFTAATDNVGVTGYDVSKDAGTSWTAIAPATSYTFAGLTAGTSYALRVRAKDAAGNLSNVLSISQSTAAGADTMPPTMNGVLTVGTITTSSATVSWLPGSDNLGVTSYEVSSNGIAWTDTYSTVTSYTFVGLAAGTIYTLQVRAKDAAGNVSAPLSVNVTTTAAAAGAPRPSDPAPTDPMTWPARVRIGVEGLAFEQRRFDMLEASDATGDTAVRLFGPPRWAISINCPAGLPVEEGAEWEALLLSLRGSVRRIAAHDLARPVPRGTARGSITLSAAAAAGATTLNLAGMAANSTLEPGDWLQVGSGLGTSQLVKVIAYALLPGPVFVEPPLRRAYASGTPVVWDKPIAYYRAAPGSRASWSYYNGQIQRGFALDLVEVFA